MDFLPPHVRAGVFVLVAIGCAALFFYQFGPRIKEARYWIVSWILLTAVAFISKNIWVFVLCVVLVCFYFASKNQKQPLVYYFAILPLLPMFKFIVPFPGINYLATLTYPRLLSLCLLLPLAIQSLRSAPRMRYKPLVVDKLFLWYFLLLCILTFRNPTLTSSLREVLYLSLDVFLPFFVISRCVRSFEDIQAIFLAILFSAIVVAFIALFEEIFRWWFYQILPRVLEFKPLSFASRIGVTRFGLLRVKATLGPIPLGYFIALAFGMLFYLYRNFPIKKTFLYATVCLFALITFFTGSRAAWLAVLCVLAVYAYLNLRARARMILIAVCSVAVAGVLATADVDLLSLDKTGTFQYRINLIDNSIETIKKDPWFGKENFKKTDELEALRQGQGIIDIVNTYLGVALHSGIIGLSLFLAILLGVILNLRKAINSIILQKNIKMRSLGNTLLAMTVATILMIGTVSSVSFIPLYYWSLFGLCIAYVKITRFSKAHLDTTDSESETSLIKNATPA